LQVVFCVNLGTFLKCFLQLGWRLTGVRSTLTEYNRMFPELAHRDDVAIWLHQVNHTP
jgi:hypothetical protein